MNPEDGKNEKVVDRGKYDPGWNDPPTFSYNPQATAVKPKLALNKRVAFPMSGSPGNANALSSSQLPPNIPCNPLLPMNPVCQTLPSVPVYNSSPSLPIPSSQSSTCDQSQEQCDVNEVMEILNELLNNNQELGNKLVDIRKRINMMKVMWEEEKLPMVVKTSTVTLVKALRDSDTKTADDIHKALMVDHSCVRSWMVAIKQLILHCSAKNELLGIEESEKREET